MNRKNFLKNKKINWIKVVIQILSFALIPGLFEGEFAAVGNIVSCIYKGNISWESVKYSVWMLVATVPATVLVGRFFCGFFCRWCWRLIILARGKSAMGFWCFSACFFMRGENLFIFFSCFVLFWLISWAEFLWKTIRPTGREFCGERF